MNRNHSTRRDFLKLAGLTASALPLVGCREEVVYVEGPMPDPRPTPRPNILWLSCEDIGRNLGCYGDPDAKTPTLDQLAADGMRYENAFVVAGVCAPTRSSIITGVYPTTLGTHHMRSGGEGVDRSIKPKLPTFIRPFPEYLRQVGYYCTNNSKEDYNFVTPKSAWDESSGKAHWRNRPNPDRPFFAVFNYTGTHEGSVRLSDEGHADRTKRLTPEQRQDPDKVHLPPYYPDTPVTRKQWAKYLELITAMDYWVADHLKELQEAGLDRDTIVFFWSDHGAGMPRAKRWVYDSGTHVPLIVRIPPKFRVPGQGSPGSVVQELVSSIDYAPTVLNLANQEIPDHMQGRPFLGTDLPAKRRYVFSARDRMDERYDIIRSVRDDRYRYIRNYQPYKEYYQYIQSAEAGPVMQELRRLHKEGKLPAAAKKFMAETKPIEELYDTQNDPHELNNLAADPRYAEVLRRMRGAHVKWMLDTRDLGLIPEPVLVQIEREYGTRYAYLQEERNQRQRRDLFYIAALAGDPHLTYRSKLADALREPDPAVRYWGAIGLGNLGDDAGPAMGFLQSTLHDPSPVVRIAAARAFCMLGECDQGLPVLVEQLQSPLEWVRLHAAIALDELDEKARPAIPELKKALDDRHNKYVVRVANHALNELEGTSNRVR